MLGGVRVPVEQRLRGDDEPRRADPTLKRRALQEALLERTPEPSEHEIRFWLAGNLCRCTGYDKIVRAVQEAAARGRGA